MVEGSYKVIWDQQAKRDLKEIVDYIKSKSFQNSLKVKNDIITKARGLCNNPQIHSPDKFKLSNDHSYRYFILHRIRVTFKIKDANVLILRCRHTSREPLFH